MTKKVVKKKLKIKNFLFLLLLIAVISLSVYFFINLRVKNIIITGNNQLNDDYIIELASLKDYPKLIGVRRGKLESLLEENKYIKSVDVSKNLFGKVVIDIDENLSVFNYTFDNSVYLEDGSVVSADNFNTSFIPRLTSDTPKDKRDDLLLELLEIDDSVINEISDIEYVPNEFDDDRFLLYMDDATLVYTTLAKFDVLNDYFDYLEQLENRKGILYLDSGNYFEIRE